MGQRSQRSIRSFLLQPFKQIRIGLYFIGILVLFFVITGTMFLHITYEQHLAVMGYLNLNESGDFWDLFENAIVQSGLIKVAVVMLVFFLFTVVASIVLTHRIYGPLISINRILGQLEQGQYGEQVQLRQNDELHDLADQINALSKTLEKRHGDSS